MAKNQIIEQMFEGDPGTLGYAKDAGVYIPGIEAIFPENRQSFDAASVVGAKRSGFFLTFGQSNGANTGEGIYRPRHPVYTLNVFDMRWYWAEDPLPGATGNGGSVWGRLGDLLVDAGLYRQVMFIPIAVGGSYLADWAPGGPLYRRLIFAIERTKRAAIPIDALLWHQGESEANLTDMTREQYRQSFLEMTTAIRARNIQAPIYVSQATYCANGDHPYKNRGEIRAAQRELVSIHSGILPGPDTDTIADDGRVDRCHFSVSGLEKCAQLWLKAMQPSLRYRLFFLIRAIRRLAGCGGERIN